MKIYVSFSFSFFFWVFSYDFVSYTHFTYIVASSTVIDDISAYKML